MNNATLAADTSGLTPGTTRFFIIVNDSTDAVVGTFNGQANGSTVNFGNYLATISYVGNSGTNAVSGGNDVVLYNFTPTPEPTVAIALAAFGLVVLRRRK